MAQWRISWGDESSLLLGENWRDALETLSLETSMFPALPEFCQGLLPLCKELDRQYHEYWHCPSVQNENFLDALFKQRRAAEVRLLKGLTENQALEVARALKMRADFSPHFYVA